MKKILILLCLIIVCFNSYSEGVYIKEGMMFHQKIKEKWNSEEYSKLSDRINLDISFDVQASKRADFGFGTELFSQNFTVEEIESSLSMHPIYAQWKYNFRRDKKINPYFISKVGFTHIHDDDSNIEHQKLGEYAGVGIGIEIKSFIIQLLADYGTVNYREKIDLDNDLYFQYVRSDYRVERVTLSFGLNLYKYFKK